MFYTTATKTARISVFVIAAFCGGVCDAFWGAEGVLSISDYPWRASKATFSCFFHVYALAINGNAFRFEQAPLKTRMWLSNQQTSACANYSMPRYTFPARAGGHGGSGCSCAAAQPEGPRDRAAGWYAAPRKFFR